ncbi:MAG: WecB/TagA/CpsF family glycosyltransferase [Microbacteriaceae bacterium]
MTTTGAPAPGSVIGVPVAAVTCQQIVDLVSGWAGGARHRPYVAVGVNAHVCNLAATDATFRADLAAADLAYADGQSVVWAARLLGTPVPHRVATTDLVYPLAERCEAESRSWFFYGGRAGVAEAAAARLRLRHPALRILTNDGFVRADDMHDLVARINRAQVDVLFVGLGDPLQQRWIAEHRHELQVAVILSCGGLFDWTSGSNRRAPQWMIRAGLEWLWRLMIEPRRLGKRYLVGNPAFVGRVLRERLRS